MSTARTSRSVHFAFLATGREISGLRPWVGVVLRLLVVVVLTGASLAGVVHTVGTGPPSTLVSGLPRGWGRSTAEKARIAEHPDRPTRRTTWPPPRSRPIPSVQRPDRRRTVALRRADQAADHRAAARHHRAGDVPRRGRGPVALAGASRPSSAARSRAGAANTLNCVYDRDIDAADAPHEQPAAGHRRRSRPRGALVFGAVLARRCRRSGSRCVVNWLSAVLVAGRDRRSTSSSTRCCSSGAPRRTSCGAARPAACRC